MTLAYILEKLQKLKVVLVGYGFGPDHLHLFVSNVRFVSEIGLVKEIKGYNLYMMRKHFSYLFRAKLYGKKFWSEGHFYRSIGAVNFETMKEYVKNSQEKHWKKFHKDGMKLLLCKKELASSNTLGVLTLSS